jgi:hypothetical protein
MQAAPESEQFPQLLRDFEFADDKPAELEEFGGLLDTFGSLQWLERKRQKTLLEIARFPGREIPYSNILAFLLDPNEEEHGLEDLILRSILQAANETDLLKTLPARRVKVTREDPTEENKRIDIVVETESFLLGIENKIFADTQNPFKEYSEHLKKKAGANGKTWKAVLLSLRSEAPDEKLCGFKPLCYDDLFVALRGNLGARLSSAHPKHLFYLLDFIETLENLKLGVDMMDRNLMAFFREHEKVACRFRKKTDELVEELTGRCKQMKDVTRPKDVHMKSEESPDRFAFTTWFEVDLGGGVRLGVQVTLGVKEWEISTYAWYEKGCEKGREWVERLMKPDTASLGRWQKEGEADLWVYASYAYEVREEIVQNKFQELIDLVAKHLPSGWKAI